MAQRLLSLAIEECHLRRALFLGSGRLVTSTSLARQTSKSLTVEGPAQSRGALCSSTCCVAGRGFSARRLWEPRSKSLQLVEFSEPQRVRSDGIPTSLRGTKRCGRRWKRYALDATNLVRPFSWQFGEGVGPLSGAGEQAKHCVRSAPLVRVAPSIWET